MAELGTARNILEAVRDWANGLFAAKSHTHTKNQITDFPTIPTVNNPTITFTQGGVSKGTITLNQSSSKTIAFDAGGGGAVTSVNGYTGAVDLTGEDIQDPATGWSISEFLNDLDSRVPSYKLRYGSYQWQGDGSETINFSTPFPSRCDSVVAWTSGEPYAQLGFESKTRTGFTAYTYDESSLSNCMVYYIAVGI